MNSDHFDTSPHFAWILLTQSGAEGGLDGLLHASLVQQYEPSVQVKGGWSELKTVKERHSFLFTESKEIISVKQRV